MPFIGKRCSATQKVLCLWHVEHIFLLFSVLSYSKYSKYLKHISYNMFWVVFHKIGSHMQANRVPIREGNKRILVKLLISMLKWHEVKAILHFHLIYLHGGVQ